MNVKDAYSAMMVADDVMTLAAITVEKLMFRLDGVRLIAR